MSDLDRLFYWRGIANDFYNYRGEHVQVPIKNRLALLDAMGVDTSSPEKIADAAYKLDVAPWLEWFPSLVLQKQGVHAGFTINLDPTELSTRFTWRAKGEGRVEYSGDFIASDLDEVGDYLFEGVRYTRRKMYIQDIASGYYRLEVTSDTGKRSTTTLAISPDKAFIPDFIPSKKRCWGVVVQLYTLRTGNDWGIGDFRALKELVSHLAAFGADTIGLNPLHALLPDLKEKYSPYSPSDRRFLCPLYIDPRAIPEYELFEKNEASSAAQTRKEKIAELQAAKYVNYFEVANLKYPVYEKMFEYFLQEEINIRTRRGQEFLKYCVNSGDVLKLFALYEGVCNRWETAEHIIPLERETLEKIIAEGEWKSVVEEYQDVVLFHSYLQWLAHDQLSGVQAFAKLSGMRLGLIRDLAVGADGSGAEATCNPSLFCRGAAVGAPPDPLAEQGQNWGLPPMDPAGLRKTGFEHYINLLRENMSLCGALRIDHAMSMMRLWWCPPGKTADYGAYVYYPFEEMIGLLALESQRNKCLIIAEDLGVVPDEFRQVMQECQLFSNKVFYFEKTAHDRFRRPFEYESNALSMINNHDVPTLASWWSCSDLSLRNTLNIFEEGVTYEQMLDNRRAEKAQVLELLDDCDLLPKGWLLTDVDKEIDYDLVQSVLWCGAKSSSQVFVIQLEDLLMMEEPVNVPGTYLEHANWQRKISNTLNEIFSDPNVIAALNRLNDLRHGN